MDVVNATIWPVFKRDIKRKLYFEGKSLTCFNALLSIFNYPSLRKILLYRVNSYLYFHGYYRVSKLITFVFSFFARSEIHMGSKIGPGLVISDYQSGLGIPRFAVIGKNCTFLGRSLLTIGGMEGVDFESDKIIIGDDCVIGCGSILIGNIKLANGTQVKNNAVVMTSNERSGAILSGMPARRRSKVDVDVLKEWNPIKERMVNDMDLVEDAPPKNIKEVITDIKKDVKFRCLYENKEPSPFSVLKLLLTPGVMCIWLFRFQQYFDRKRVPFVGVFFKFISRFLWGVSIDSRANITGGIMIAHAYSIVINGDVDMGEGCVLFHQVTLGGKPFYEPGVSDSSQRLTVGDGVIFGAGSAICGKYNIADKTKISINTVVERDTSYGDVVFGIPGRIVSSSAE